MKVEVRMNPKTGLKGDAGTIRIEIARLHNKYGKLTPAVILEAAKYKTNPMHGEFEWDDKKAAVAHRRNQALYLIRHVEIVIQRTSKAKPVSHRMYVPVSEDRSEFIDVRDAMNDPEMRKQLKDRLYRKLYALTEELARFEEFVNVVAAIKSLKRAA